MHFYDVDSKFTEFLRKHDRQVPVISYTSHDKFICGVVFNINNIDYYAPISSFGVRQRTNYLITNSKGNTLGSIRFCFMFPALKSALSEKDIGFIAKTDRAYADLLLEEYEICMKQEADIRNRAEYVYKIGCNKNHPLNYACCDFQKLEAIYSKFGE